MGEPKTSDHIEIKIKISKSTQEPPASSKATNQDLKDIDVLCSFKIKIELKNSDHGCIIDQGPYPKIKMQNLSQEPPASSKVSNQDLKDIDFLCNFKIKIGNKKLEHWCTKDQ